MNGSGVMTIIYFEDEMRLAQPVRKTQYKDWAKYLPGAEVGKPIDTPLNPVIYSHRT
jgi:hypothetical protein